MECPGFSELGKSARDVFKTGYHYGKGLYKFTVKSRHTDVFDMTSDVSLNCDIPKLDGMLETKYKVEPYLNLIQKWTAEGTGFIGTEITGKLLEGLTLLSESFYNPQSNLKGTRMEAKYANERFNGVFSIANDSHFNGNANLNFYGSVVVKFKELICGYQCGYKMSSKEFTKNDVGVAFSYGDLALHWRCTSIPHEFGCSVLYKVNTDWEVAMNGITAKSGGWHEWMVGAAAKYNLDESTILRFKLNSTLQFGTSMEVKANENATMAFSINLDCGNLPRGSHKIGLALDIEA